MTLFGQRMNLRVASEPVPVWLTALRVFITAACLVIGVYAVGFGVIGLYHLAIGPVGRSPVFRFFFFLTAIVGGGLSLAVVWNRTLYFLASGRRK
jgi:hypothetical protein